VDAHAGALVDQGRGLERFDQHLVLVVPARGDREHVDLDAVLAGDAGLLLGLAQVLVAVADQHDALACTLGEAG
jgi:hypothetical protein